MTSSNPPSSSNDYRSHEVPQQKNNHIKENIVDDQNWTRTDDQQPLPKHAPFSDNQHLQSYNSYIQNAMSNTYARGPTSPNPITIYKYNGPHPPTVAFNPFMNRIRQPQPNQESDNITKDSVPNTRVLQIQSRQHAEIPKEISALGAKLQKERRDAHAYAVWQTDAKLIPKNTNPQWHSMSDSASYCVLCHQKLRHVALHYLITHKNSEVYTSRLPPVHLTNFQSNIGNKALYSVTKSPNLTLYYYRCPFCALRATYSLLVWLNHFITHTGEYRFKCSKCFKGINNITTLSDHISKYCPGAETISRYLPPLSRYIEAYVCHLCNFIQLLQTSVVRHLETEHGVQDSNSIEAIITVKLINVVGVPQKQESALSHKKSHLRGQNARGKTRSRLISAISSKKSCPSSISSSLEIDEQEEDKSTVVYNVSDLDDDVTESCDTWQSEIENNTTTFQNLRELHPLKLHEEGPSSVFVETNLSPPGVMLVGNFGYSLSGDSLKYYCMVKGCVFILSDDSDGLQNHFLREHPMLKWNGFCSTCQLQVQPNGANEMQHMLHVHTKPKIAEQSFDNLSTDTQPSALSVPPAPTVLNEPLAPGLQCHRTETIQPTPRLIFQTVTATEASKQTTDQDLRQNHAPSAPQGIQFNQVPCLTANGPALSLPTTSQRISTSKKYPAFKCGATRCNFRTNLQPAMNEHLNFHLGTDNDPGAYKCHECSFMARDIPDYFQHMTQAHPNTTSSPPSTNQLIWKIRSILQAPTYHNDSGSHVEQSREAANKYVAPMSNSERPTEVCNMNFQPHLTPSSTPKPLKCPHCTASYNCQEQLTDHVNSHARSQYVCYICCAAFTTLQQTQEHFFENHVRSQVQSQLIMLDEDNLVDASKK